MGDGSAFEVPGPEPEVPLFFAYVSVKSSDLRLDDIKVAVGTEHEVWGDYSHDIGDMSRRRGVPFDWSSWAMQIVFDPSEHPGTEGFPDAIERLGPDLADRLAELEGRSCNVTVQVCQTLNNDQSSSGIHLTPGALAWVTRARACVDIDQYIEWDDYLDERSREAH